MPLVTVANWSGRPDPICRAPGLVVNSTCYQTHRAQLTLRALAACESSRPHVRCPPPSWPPAVHTTRTPPAAALDVRLASPATEPSALLRCLRPDRSRLAPAGKRSTRHTLRWTRSPLPTSPPCCPTRSPWGVRPQRPSAYCQAPSPHAHPPGASALFDLAHSQQQRGRSPGLVGVPRRWTCSP